MKNLIQKNFTNINAMKCSRVYERTIKNSSADYSHIEITLEYELGGINYFSGSVKERGIYIYIKGCFIADGWKEYAPFGNGGYKLLKPLNRASKKEFEKVIAYIDNNFMVVNDVKMNLFDVIASKFEIGEDFFNILENITNNLK